MPNTAKVLLKTLLVRGLQGEAAGGWQPQAHQSEVLRVAGATGGERAAAPWTRDSFLTVY